SFGGLRVGLLPEVVILEGDVFEDLQARAGVAQLFLINVRASQLPNALRDQRRAKAVSAADFDNVAEANKHLSDKLIARDGEGQVFRIVDIILRGSCAE